ncbi:MAG: 4Fe-4S binding protein [Erysipelothrix sp.]|nr:4Fe-4S binding protein [Erysipelothrix sp.]
MKYTINTIRVLFLGLFVILLVNDKLMLWLVLFGISLLLALFFGRIYCGFMCPMNTLMIPTEVISKKLGIQSDKTPKWLSSGNFGWFALVVSLIAFFFTRFVLNKNFPVLIVWILASVLITIRYKPEVFHNLICPYGILQKIFGKFAFFSEKVNEDKCIGCKLCETVCPSKSVVVSPINKKAKIDSAICLQCTNCQQICPTKAITYTLQR